MEPEVATRYEENLQEANAARDREELEANVSLCRQEMPADTSVVILVYDIIPVHSSLFVFPVSSCTIT